MKGSAILAVQACALALAVLVATPGLTQERAVYAKPTWQKDSGCAKRTVADVSAVADPNTGVAVFGPSGRGNRSAWLVFGGTSVAAPLVAGVYGVNDTAEFRQRPLSTHCEFE